jgi:hypothetical protein
MGKEKKKKLNQRETAKLLEKESSIELHSEEITMFRKNILIGKKKKIKKRGMEKCNGNDKNIKRQGKRGGKYKVFDKRTNIFGVIRKKRNQ